MTLDPEDYPVLVNVPHLGRLRWEALDGHTVTLATVDRNQNPLLADADHKVEINNVEYRRIVVTAHTAAWFADHPSHHSPYMTTDGSWGVRPYDLSAQRCDSTSYRGRQITQSAATKLAKRTVLFLDTYMSTADARRKVAEAAHREQQSKIDYARKEIARLRKMLDREEERLAELLDADVTFLMDLRRALRDDGDLTDLTERST